MRTIRAIYNKAIKSGLVEKKYYPFDLFKIKTTPTKKRAISIVDIQKIMKVSVQDREALSLSKDIFLASFYLMGMNFTDLSFLKKENIVNNRIVYQRAKTAQQFDIAIIPELKIILKKYLKGLKSREFIFPILQNIEENDIYDKLQAARSRHNKRLKEIARRAGIDKSLTTYVGRHSFATIAKNKNIPISAISEMLGHKSIKTTQIYLDSLNSDKRDEYHLDVLRF